MEVKLKRLEIEHKKWKWKKILENSRETRISLVSGTKCKTRFLSQGMILNGVLKKSFCQKKTQRPARFSFLENFREFFFIFTSRSQSRAVSISLSLLEKEWRDFIFHFSLLEKSESYRYFTLFSREKRVKLGPGYNLTSIFVPNCISKDSQISSKYKPQNIGQISVLKSWPTPMLHVCTNLQHKKNYKKFSLDILTKLQLFYQTVVYMFLISSNIDNCSSINKFSVGIFAYQSLISQVWNWLTDKAM